MTVPAYGIGRHAEGGSCSSPGTTKSRSRRRRQPNLTRSGTQPRRRTERGGTVEHRRLLPGFSLQAPDRRFVEAVAKPRFIRQREAAAANFRLAIDDVAEVEHLIVSEILHELAVRGRGDQM